MDLPDDDGRGLLFGIKRPRRELGEGCEIAPPPLQPDLPNGDGNKPGQHDGNEGRKVVPQHHGREEIGGVVLHQSKDRVFIKRREGTPYKAPHGIPQTGEKKEQQSRKR